MIYSVIAPIFLIVLIGFFVGKLKKIDIDPLVSLVIYIAAPSLIITSIANADIAAGEFLSISLVALVIMLIASILAFFVIKVFRIPHLGLFLPMVFGNTGNLGFPVLLLSFGAEGLARGIAYDVVSGVLLFSMGVYIINKNRDIKEIFRIPLLYAVVAGLFLNAMNLQLPPFLATSLELIGGIAVPAMLLMLGYRLAHVKMESWKWASIAAVFKMGVGFALAFLALRLFPFPVMSANAIQLEAAMPAAVMSSLLSEKYKRDSDVVASTVLLSTVLSLVTIPLILWWLGA